MAAVRGIVTRWLDDHQPGFVVEFILTDVDGVVHVVHEKVPVLTVHDLTSSVYPRELWIDADVLSRGLDGATVRLRHSVESVAGRNEFTLPLTAVRTDG